MEIPMKNLRCGLSMPVLGFGTGKMGGGEHEDKKKRIKKDILSVRMALRNGIRRFDTAEAYANGYSEKILGMAIKDFARSELFITSKVSPLNLKHDQVLKSAEDSLRRLGLDYLDLYLIHAPNHYIPLKQTLKAFDRLKEEGLIKNMGVSNFNAESLQKAQNLTINKIVLNQVHYNLIFREPEVKGVLKYCQDNDIFLEAFRSMEEGNLSRSGIAMLDKIAEKYKKTQSQIAINWLIFQKNVIALTKTNEKKHLLESIGSLYWKLDKSDVMRLSREFPIQLKQSNVIQLS